MRRNRVVIAVVFSVALAVAICLYVIDRPLPMQKNSFPNDIDAERVTTVRAISMDGKEFTVRGQFNPVLGAVLPAVVPNGYLVEWNVDVSEKLRKQLGVKGTSYIYLLEMRNVDHSVRWRLLHAGSQPLVQCNTRGEVALILADSRIQGPDGPWETISSVLVSIDASGKVKWRAKLDRHAMFGLGIQSNETSVLLDGNTDDGYRWALYNKNGRPIKLSQRLPKKTTYLGTDHGCYLFADLLQGTGEKTGYITKLAVWEMDQLGKVSQKLKIETTRFIYGTRIAEVKGKMSLLIATSDGRISYVLLQGGKRTELVKFDKTFITFPDTLRGTAPIFAGLSTSREADDPELWSIIYLEPNQRIFRTLIHYASDMHSNYPKAAYIPYDRQTVLILVPGKSVETSRLCLVNKLGKMLCDYKVSFKADVNAVVVPAYGLVVNWNWHEPINTLPITAAPTISTTMTAEELRVRITCATKGASISYSVNDRDPDSKGQSYRGEFIVPKGSTITARATAPRTLPSQIAEVVGK